MGLTRKYRTSQLSMLIVFFQRPKNKNFNGFTLKSVAEKHITSSLIKRKNEIKQKNNKRYYYKEKRENHTYI